MDEQRYYFIAHSDDDAWDGGLPPAVMVISIPWWTECVKHHYREANESVDAPLIFTSQEMAEAQLRQIMDRAPGEYLRLVEEHGAADVGEALDNTAPLHIFSLDRRQLLDKLEDSDFLCVEVDGRMKLRQDLIEDLRQEED